MKTKISIFVYVIIVLFYNTLHSICRVLDFTEKWEIFILRILKILIIFGFVFFCENFKNKIILLIYYPIMKSMSFLFEFMDISNLFLDFSLNITSLTTIFSLFLISSNPVIIITYTLISYLFFIYFGKTFTLVSIAFVLGQSQLTTQLHPVVERDDPLNN